MDESKDKIKKLIYEINAYRAEVKRLDDIIRNQIEEIIELNNIINDKEKGDKNGNV